MGISFRPPSPSPNGFYLSPRDPISSGIEDEDPDDTVGNTESGDFATLEYDISSVVIEKSR